MSGESRTISSDGRTCAYIDMHCDTLLRTLREPGETLYDGKGMQSLRQMRDAGQMCQFFAVFFPPQEELMKNLAMGAGAACGTDVLQEKAAACGADMGAEADREFWRILTQNLRREVAEHADFIALAKSGSEIEANYREGKLSAVLTIEDGRMVNGSMDRLISLKEEGVCAIALTWNFANCFGFPNSGDPAVMNAGLTSFGKEAIEVMNETGILVDVSHLSDGGFWDVARLTRKPFVATHSNCRALSPHTRNLTDEMIRALAEKGGVSGLNFCPEFLSADLENQATSVTLLADHVMHFIQVGGEDCVGLGTDFDGIGGALEIGHPTQMHLLFEELSRRGLTQRQLDKVRYGNVLRVMRESIG